LIGSLSNILQEMLFKNSSASLASSGSSIISVKKYAFTTRRTLEFGKRTLQISGAWNAARYRKF
jgi:hypothetical protein